jgi:hypothetical protein
MVLGAEGGREPEILGSITSSNGAVTTRSSIGAGTRSTTSRTAAESLAVAAVAQDVASALTAPFLQLLALLVGNSLLLLSIRVVLLLVNHLIADRYDSKRSLFCKRGNCSGTRWGRGNDYLTRWSRNSSSTRLKRTSLPSP